MQVKKEWLRTQVEQGEPTDSGEWFVLELADLIKQGFTYVEIHFPDTTGNDDECPNAVHFTKEA